MKALIESIDCLCAGDILLISFFAGVQALLY